MMRMKKEWLERHTPALTICR